MEICTVPGKDAPATLDRLRAEFATTGAYPILLGHEKPIEELPSPDCVANILQASRELNLAEWLSEQPEADEEVMDSADDAWPSVQPMELITHLNILTNRPHPEVQIAKLPINAPWEAFAHLGYGDWNDCPAPEAHCALHRSWEERFGAQVISITRDIVQCVVERPPTTQEAALALAREQYAYCYDIVEQGTETIPALAASLLNARYWYFWWD